MNSLLPKTIVIATAFAVAPLTYASTWTPDFTQDPYTTGATIVGVDGWTLSDQDKSSATTDALILEIPAVSNSPLLRLKRTVSGGNHVRVVNRSFGELRGETRLTVGMAFDFNPTANSGTRASVALTDLSTKASPLAFGVDFSASGGLFYYGADGGAEVILTKDQIKMNSLYTFTLDIDISGGMFDITVSGLKADDSTFSYTMKGVEAGAFGSSSDPRIDLFYLENSANPNFTAYVDHIAFQPIPEPSTALLLLGAGAAGVGLLRANRNR